VSCRLRAAIAFALTMLAIAAIVTPFVEAASRLTRSRWRYIRHVPSR